MQIATTTSARGAPNLTASMLPATVATAGLLAHLTAFRARAARAARNLATAST